MAGKARKKAAGKKPAKRKAAPKVDPWVSVRQLARELNLSHTAVQKALLAGRIEKGSTRPHPKRSTWQQLHRDKATADLARNTDLAQVRENHRQPGEPTDPDPDQGKLFETGGKPPPDAEEIAGRRTYALNRAEREGYVAGLEGLKLAQLQGELVPAAEVIAERWNTARTVRDALLAIPHRVDAELAAETDVGRVRTRLFEELHLVLRTLVEDGREAARVADGPAAAAG